MSKKRKQEQEEEEPGLVELTDTEREEAGQNVDDETREAPANETPDMIEATGALTEDGEAGIKPPPTPEEADALHATWQQLREAVNVAQTDRAFWTEALTGDTPATRLLDRWLARIESLTKELKPLGQKMDELRDKQAHIQALEENVADVRAQLTNAERLHKDRADALAVFERANKALVDQCNTTTALDLPEPDPETPQEPEAPAEEAVQ